MSIDNKIRVWEIPEGGIEEDVAEPKCVFGSSSMDKVHLIEFHPTTKDVLLTTSDDLGHPTVRIWDVQAQKEEIVLKDQHKDAIFSCAWSPDGTQIATTTKEKKLRILDARTGDIVAEGPSHNSIRPSRLVWLDTELLASVGFGLGSSREVLLMSKEDVSKPLCRKTIDISPSIMSAYYDADCHILFVAGRGDRTIHTYHLEQDRQLTAVAKIEGTTLQQGFAFLPKKTCHVKDIEIDRFYRLTPNSIESVGVRVPRARVSCVSNRNEYRLTHCDIVARVFPRRYFCAYLRLGSSRSRSSQLVQRRQQAVGKNLTAAPRHVTLVYCTTTRIASTIQSEIRNGQKVCQR